jgi:protein-tyrosine phosphatase
MLTQLPFDFPGEVYRSSMPFGPFDRRGSHWQSYQEQGVDLVVVLTEPQEYLVFAGRDLPDFYRAEALDVIQVSIPDHGLPPDPDLFEDALSRVEQAGQAGRTIAVHCLAGIGRTGTFLACLAVKNLGLAGDQAPAWVREYVPSALETPAQVEYVKKYASLEKDRGRSG